ncbi:TonB-dependent siderophore receptor [Herminiimonas arsenitoxidans]|uniref:TonB-dependent siderophore receptor n=1 Tax=Herminiimonas arsenitoxidans TaxID=1809410 RepID=UPI0009706C2D|nr:TonB-dependent siderophore receptor [Herminiimonas arsenitoxidans]
MLCRKTITLAVSLAWAVPFSAALAQQGDSSSRDVDLNTSTTTLPAVHVTTVSDGSSEHTGSYAAQAITIGSKIPQTVRETPFSISVITRQRLDDQNITKIEDVLKQTTGMIVTRFDGGGNANSITARGFSIGSIQLDGLPIGQATNYTTALDTSLYDRIEVLRGPAGLLQGAGEPGGTINLVRKRARADFAGNAAVMLGSWDARRAEFDVTSKLVESGAIRARVVGVVDNRDSYVDIVKNDKTVGYGTIEMDLSPQTTLSLGASQQKLDTVRDLGLPTYANGTLINLPRSTFVGRSGNTQKQETSEMFAELEHRLSGGGLMKFSAREVERYTYDYGVRGNSFPNPLTGLMNLQGAASERETTSRNLDAYITTPFELGGRTHRALVGMSYSTENDKTASTTTGPAGGGTLNIFQPNYNVALPVMNIGPYTTGANQTQTGIYGQVQLKPFDRWTFLLGGRVSRWNTEAVDLISGVVTSPQKLKPKFTPLTAAIFELNQQSSLYASYAETFVAQTALDINNKLLAPRTGSQIEFGIKSEFYNKRLNTHLALFRIFDKDRAIADPNNTTKSVAGGEIQSQGLEAEVSGQIRPGWEMTAGYAYTDFKYLKVPVNAVTTGTPKHNVNVWSKHTWRDGAFKRWSVAGGLRSMSKTYATSGTAANPIRIDAKGYTIFNAQIGYQISPTTTASLTVNNLFDKTYYEKVSMPSRQNFYGEPRSVMLALRTAW